MQTKNTVRLVALLGAVICAASAASAEPRKPHRLHREVAQALDEDRPLTITGRRRHGGVYRVGNTIVAPGGFSANGYGYPVATADDRREALNARIRANASGPFGYGVDGIGGLGFEDSPETGYSNPYYGNAFNSYVGYNGVPTDLSFGPGYANRHIADHDPADDDDDDDTPPPSPASLGYGQGN